MKKNLIKIVVFTIIATSLFAVTKPSIEGRAVVAQQGELPPGMYVKAHSFLPGDSVIITNLSTKTSVEVFVFETIDTGVAAVVSPEVAEKLFISDISDSLVQIRKVVVQPKIAEKEIVALSEKKLEEETIANIEAEKEMEALSKEIESELQEKVEVIEVVEEIDEIAEIERVVVDENVETPIPNLDEQLDNFIDSLVLENENVAVEEVVEATPIQDEDSTIFTPFSDMSTMFPEVSYDNEPSLEELVVSSVVDDEYAIETPDAEEDKLEDFLVADIPVEEVEDPYAIATPDIEEDKMEDFLVADIPVEEEVEDPYAIATPDIEEDKMEDFLVADIPMEEEIEDPYAIATPDIEEDKIEDFLVADIPGEEEIEDPNVLVPTEDNPAIALEEEPEVILFEDFFADVEETVLEEEVEDEYAVATPNVEEERLEDFFIEEVVVETAVESVEIIDEYAMKPAVEVIEEVVEINFDEFLVDNLKNNGSRKYYVQLATYKDSENISDILTNYGEKYPLSLVESPSIQDAYQVVVGPLTSDEYTIVLERFKSYGYKDAFLRIAQ